MINNLLQAFATNKVNSMDLNSIFPKAPAKTSNDDSGFGEVLDSKLKGYERSENNKKEYKYDLKKNERKIEEKHNKPDSNSKSNDPGDNSKRDLDAKAVKVDNTGKAEAKNTKKAEQVKPKDVKDDSPVDNHNSEDNQTDMTVKLAAALELKPEEVNLLLNALNITPDDLNSLGITEVVQKLSDLMGLDSKEKSTLEWLLNNADDYLGNLTQKASTLSKPISKDFVKLDGIKVEVLDLRDNKGFKNIVEALKGKLDETSSKLSINPEAFKNEFHNKLDAYMMKLHSSENKQSEESIPDDLTEDVSNTEAKGVEKAQAKNVSKQETKQEMKQGREDGNPSAKDQANTEMKTDKPTISQTGNPTTKTTVSTETLKTESNSINSKDIQVNPNNMEAQKANAKTITETTKVASTAKNEIIHQFVEKAKVILNNDKSEMTMDLKPESLGKLSLKIVTENGIVTAKFLAESQQVKEVLETNMQLLKDSLEKQGISVQGFSVNVGQDSSRHSGENKNNNGSKNQGAKSDTSFNYTDSARKIWAFEDRQNANLYMPGETSINLRA